MEFVIWSNMNLNLDDWRDDIRDEYPDASEDEMYQIMHEINDEYLDDEKCNLDVDLDEDIVCIADLGRWDGRYKAVAPLGSNLKDIFSISSGDYTEWYVDLETNELKERDCHYDGTNYYEFRKWKGGLDYFEKEDLIADYVYEGKNGIYEKTEPLGKKVAEVCGRT